MATDSPAADRRTRSGVRAVLLAIGVAVLAFVVGNLLVALAALVLGLFGIALLSAPALQVLVGTVLLQGVAFGGTALLYLRYRGDGLAFLRTRVPTLRDIGWIVGGFAALLGLLALTQVVFSTLGIQSAQNQIVELASGNPIVFLILVPLSFLLVGPGEELLFRGLVQGTIAEALHPARAVVLASAIFALVHYGSLAGSGKFAYLGVVFALALVLGATYELTDNLVVPALIHGAYNAVQFGIQYLAATGGL
ncbi:CPBP family intramembrane metalloprotease domain-containing protein [Halobacteriales archaeon QS_3_64_16]|nr:MAG: CPBP family intramembrane metalloprotease domain-containing protein [Halobacteriales archaeon QS_3_64_16]